MNFFPGSSFDVVNYSVHYNFDLCLLMKLKKGTGVWLMLPDERAKNTGGACELYLVIDFCC